MTHAVIFAMPMVAILSVGSPNPVAMSTAEPAMSAVRTGASSPHIGAPKTAISFPSSRAMAESGQVGGQFEYKVETFRHEDSGEMAFALRLEQRFLADEFEKSNDLRLRSEDDMAYLIYPKETRFTQKHAEFYGRLRGEGTTSVTLSYEMVSENIDGTPNVEVREQTIEIEIPADATGSRNVFQDWARKQNDYFAEMLRYYPHESFYQYCLLQSAARYGVTPPSIPRVNVQSGEDTNAFLYGVFTGSQAIQESLQRQNMVGSRRQRDLEIHVSSVAPVSVASLDYEQLLEEQREKEIEPSTHAVAALVPADQYFLHFKSINALNDVLDLTSHWGNSLMRLFTVRAQEHKLRDKLEDQLCIQSGALARLFGDNVISEIAVTGADPFVLEGTDLTLIFSLRQPAAFEAAAATWLADVRQAHPEMAEETFNYRGFKIDARYTQDRIVSSFVVRHEGAIVYSNSHRGIKKIIDAIVGVQESLADQLDYQYMTTLLPPEDGQRSGYFYASEACVRQMLAPAAKISEKRRLECFNNLVMLNNASLFYRMENAAAPASLSDLEQGNYVDMRRVVCPHGGAYAYDEEHDTCTCSLHNRLRYLTPNAELTVQNISRDEENEYAQFRATYEQTWSHAYDPIAVRITAEPRLKLETCILPLPRSGIYQQLQGMLDERPAPMSTTGIAPSAVASLSVALGRESIADWLRIVPGVDGALSADPTLTDLSWIGDRASLHFCDHESVMEVDPMQLRTLNLPFLGEFSPDLQMMAVALYQATQSPSYLTFDVEDTEKAQRLLDHLAQGVFLTEGAVFDMETEWDAFRLPDYADHPVYVISGRLYAFKVRLHVSLVGDQLVAATSADVLREVISAGQASGEREPIAAHAMLRFNRQAIQKMYGNVQMYWAEKARIACHKNVSTIGTLCALYSITPEEAAAVAEAKYGVRSFCPDHGEYVRAAGLSPVKCTVHGDRRQSTQLPTLDQQSSFAQFMESIDEIQAVIRMDDNALFTTVEIQRSGQ